MIQEMTPNTQITQENFGLLKAGDWVADGPVIGKLKGLPDGWGCATLIAPNGSEFSRILHRHRFTYIGPALSPPAEGSWDETPAEPHEQRAGFLTKGDIDAYRKWFERRAHLEDGCEIGAGFEMTPTPTPVDWNVVGPKLVEALDGIVHFTDGFGFYRTQSPAGIALEQWIDEADALLKEIDPDRGLALAATQSNGE